MTTTTPMPVPAPPSAGDDGQPSPKGRARRWKKAGPLRTLATTLAFFVVVYALALLVMRPASPGEAVTLDELLAASAAGQVEQAQFLDQDARITGTLTRDGEAVQFFTTVPRSDASTNDVLSTLVDDGAAVSVDAQSTKGLVRFVTQFLLPLVILANLFAVFFLIRSGAAGGAGGVSEYRLFGRIGNKRLAARGQTTFADVAGADEAVAELAEVRDYLADPSAFEAMGALPPKGVLLQGPPGCGKTLLARAVAGEANAAFFNVSGSEFVESLVGVGAARVRDLFAQARANAPAILFIDELDGVGRQRGTGLGGGHDEREQTLNELLVQMDGFSPSEGVVVMGATNRPDILDPALLRPGRFDRQVTVERPDVDGRLRILRLHAAAKRLGDPEADLPAVAAATPGFTGADLANVLNEAALLAVRERAATVGRAQLDEAVERSIGGPRRKAKIYSVADKRRIAYHEAGHAVVASAVGKAAALDKLSIISRGKGVGHLSMLGDDTLFPTRTDMEATIAIAMAGLAAEELGLGQFSVGSEDDLERATTLARDLAGRYGMSDRLGRVRVLANHRQVFLGRDYLSAKEVSQPTLEHLDNEVRQILADQEALATSLLASQRAVLDELADALVNHETLKDRDLRRFLHDVRPYRREPAANGTSRAPRARAPRKRNVAE